MNNEEPKIPQTVRDAIISAHAAQDRAEESLKSVLPKFDFLKNIKIPTFNFPEPIEIEIPTAPHVIQEQNAWERHEETLKIQTSILNVQNEILKDQKSNKKWSTLSLFFSGLAALFGAIAIIPVLPVLRAWFGWLFGLL